MIQTRIVLVDDHQLVRAGIRALLQEAPDLAVVGEADNAHSGLAMVRELLPDLMLLDVAMPGTSGFEILGQLNDENPEIAVLMLSMYVSEEHILRSLSHGALGYVLKNAAPEELVEAVRMARQGKVWLSPGLGEQKVADYMSRVQPNGQYEILTPRQKQVLALLAEGASTKEIAFALNLSVKTIETFRTQIMNRLQIQDLPALVRYAIRHGITSL